MKKYNKAGVILLIALCFLCLKTQCTEIQAAEKYKTINCKESKKLEQLSFMQIIQMKLEDGMYIGRKGKKKENLDLIRMCLQVFLQTEK